MRVSGAMSGCRAGCRLVVVARDTGPSARRRIGRVRHHSRMGTHSPAAAESTSAAVAARILRFDKGFVGTAGLVAVERHRPAAVALVEADANGTARSGVTDMVGSDIVSSDEDRMSFAEETGHAEGQTARGRKDRVAGDS